MLVTSAFRCYRLVPNNSILLVNQWHIRLWVFYIYTCQYRWTLTKRPFRLTNRIQRQKTRYFTLATFVVLWLYHIRAVASLKLFVGFYTRGYIEATSDVNLVHQLVTHLPMFVGLEWCWPYNILDILKKKKLKLVSSSHIVTFSVNK